MSPSPFIRNLKLPRWISNFTASKYNGGYFIPKLYCCTVGTVGSILQKGGRRSSFGRSLIQSDRRWPAIQFRRRLTSRVGARTLVAENFKKRMAAAREHDTITSVADNTEKMSLYDILNRVPSPQQTKHRGKKTSQSHSNTFPKKNFERYWSPERVSSALKRGEVKEGIIRINARNFEIAYVTPSENSESGDIMIRGIEARNRALHGDKVVIEVLPECELEKVNNGREGKVSGGEQTVGREHSSERHSVKTAKVVYISEKKHSRAAAGHLKEYKNHHFGCALLHPIDSKVPRLWIPLSDCPTGFETRPQDFSNILFAARITEWREKFAFARGSLMKSLGEAGEIAPETEACLFENGIIDEPFSEDVRNCLPHDLPWKIPDAELQGRRDLRKLCIFSVDPPTARDLDDALSIKRLECGNFEVGVHIADVSYFIQEDSALDKAAKERGTSVYLVQRVIPMLPRLLCEELCSLNPGVDRLTFSVVWTMTPDGDVVTEWFGRSVIHSCCKLSYNHAQQIIEAGAGESMLPGQFPEIFGGHALKDVTNSVNNLWAIAAKLREKRFDNGAVKLDQPKLSFSMDEDTGLPNGCTSYEYKESNMMIEEFMLLANMAVAHKILERNKNLAILRRHPKPDSKVLEELVKVCNQHGIAFDTSNSKGIHDSLQRLRNNPQVELDADGILAIISLTAKSMKLAQYFCSGWFENQELYHHYALNVPLYTHFTSPIRRYPDILVHRLLQATLDRTVQITKSVQEMQEISEHCNNKKLSSKRVQEFSSELFFLVYVRECGPLFDDAYVIGILDSAFDVICSTYGVTKRIYCNSLPLIKGGWVHEVENGQPQLKLSWSHDKVAEEAGTFAVGKGEVSNVGFTQVIKFFTKIRIALKADDKDKKKLLCVLQPPNTLLN